MENGKSLRVLKIEHLNGDIDIAKNDTSSTALAAGLFAIAGVVLMQSGNNIISTFGYASLGAMGYETAKCLLALKRKFGLKEEKDDILSMSDEEYEEELRQGKVR